MNDISDNKHHTSAEDLKLKTNDEKLVEQSNYPTLSQDRPTSIFGLFQDGRILAITSLATIGGFLFGYDQGVVGNVLVLESFGAEFPRFFADATVKGWFVSSLLLGAWLGSLISGPIVDRLGRKRSIMLQNILFLLGCALQTGAQTEVHHFVGRAIGGLAVGALTHVIPMYIAELAPSSIRGSLVALQQLAITLGILFSYWIAYGTSHMGGTRCAPEVPYTGPVSNGRATFDPYNDVPDGGCTGQTGAAWRIPVGIQMLPSVILQVGMFFMPYSPRWLVEQNREEEAKKTLAYLRKQTQDSPDVVVEFLEIKAEVLTVRELEAARNDKAQTKIGRFIQPYKELVSTKANAKRLFIGSVVMFYQQFIGCNAIIYYAPTIFASLGLDPNTTSLLATGVYGIVNTVFTLPAVFLLDRVGRRPLLMAGAIGCFLSLIVVGSSIAGTGGDFENNKTVGNMAIAFVYIYDVNFSYSWAPIGWVLPSEIFNLSTRSTGVSITTSCTWMSNFIIGLVSPIMLDNLANGGTYFFFAAFAILGFLTVYFIVPETKGATLEEMDAVFGAERSNEEQQTIEFVRRSLGLPTTQGAAMEA